MLPLLSAPFVIFAVVLAPGGPADVLIAGPVDRVVAAGEQVAVQRGDEVRVFRVDGRPLFRLGGRAQAFEVPSRSALRDREELLEQNGIAEEDSESPDAETLIEDDRSLRERRASGWPAPIGNTRRRPLLAASIDALWILAGRTLWRVEGDGRVSPTALSAPSFERLAAAPNGRLWASIGGQLWRSLDGGSTFALVTEADGPVRALAAGDEGVAWTTDRTLTWQDRAAARRSQALPAPAKDLRFCGASLMALEDESLLVVTAGGEVVAHPLGPGQRRIACAPGSPWFVVGPHLLASADDKTLLRPRVDLAVAPIDAAVGSQVLWVATQAGLLALPWRERETSPRLGLASEDLVAAIRRPADRARWGRWLPRLVLAGAALTTAGRRDLRALVYAKFPLGAGASRADLPPQLALQEATPAPPSTVASPALTGWSADAEAPCLVAARVAAVARAQVEPERARSLTSRAGLVGWLPELRVRVERRLGRSESLDISPRAAPGTGPLGVDTANDVRYEARAIWDLSKLVFSTEELAAQAQAMHMADMRREVESMANRLYYERRRLKLELVQGTSSDSRVRRELRLEELDAELDVLSGGAFSRCLPAPRL